MALFLDERLPVSIKLGAIYSDAYSAEHATDPRTGITYSRLRHNNPTRELVGVYTQATAEMWAGIVALYHRCYGGLAGFRVRFIDDFSTNVHILAPTAIDQPLEYVESGVYRLQKQYGAGSTPLSIGLPVRRLTKPVAGSVKVAIDGVEQLSGWSVDNLTGLVTFATPPSLSADVTAGCYFDVPCRFSDKFDVNHISANYRETGQIRLVEML